MIEAAILMQYSSSLFVRKKPLVTTLCALGITYLALFAVSLSNVKWLNLGLYLLLNFAFLVTQYQVKPYVAAFHSVLIAAVMSMCELVVYNLMERYSPNFFANVEQVSNTIIFILSSKLLFFIIVCVTARLLRRQGKTEQRFDKSVFFLFLIPVTTVLIMLTFVSINDSHALSPALNGMVSLSAILLLISNLFVFGLNQYNQRKNREHTELQLLLQRESSLTEYYKMVLSQSENQSILIHDIKKHLQSIELLNERNDREKIAAYVHQLLLSSDLKEISRICDNELLNAILSRYKRQCEDLNVSFVADVRSGTCNFLSEQELTSLYCNLLENAIEAAKNVQNPYVEINATERENTPFVVITMINSCLVNPIPDGDQDELPSHKPDRQKHGFGMKSIKKIVKKYNGDMQIYYNAESLTFHTIITLKKSSTNPA
ncbi:MAG: GHKL domain-containing protein [Lachnospiraceae bacterium]|jgi:signal transduction histidine kinase|nr:GHKL domain-containing protein [Lachnospiraceae bacterium]